ncbi:MAG: type II toxin-antitoxin system HicB family antitoxin [Cytophagaceae bacterium]|nr:type II toxin-antitoxin system HicB family antitoxin [Cytophagaceae bacterium]
MKPNYKIILYWSQDDDAFLATVPELPGCMADGKTYQEALANVEVVIAEWRNGLKRLNSWVAPSLSRKDICYSPELNFNPIPTFFLPKTQPNGKN